MAVRIFASVGIPLLVLSSVSSNSLAQQPAPVDTTARRVTISPPPVQVHAPMVLALVSDSLVGELDSAFKAARQVAESLGFAFTVSRARRLSLVDPRNAALYYLPSDVQRGYLIVAPGLRPDLVRGYVAADSLRQRIVSYRRHIRPRTPQKCCE